MHTKELRVVFLNSGIFVGNTELGWYIRYVVHVFV